jgi:hypothetical protein
MIRWAARRRHRGQAQAEVAAKGRRALIGAREDMAALASASVNLETGLLRLPRLDCRGRYGRVMIGINSGRAERARATIYCNKSKIGLG